MNLLRVVWKLTITSHGVTRSYHLKLTLILLPLPSVLMMDSQGRGAQGFTQGLNLTPPVVAER